MQSHSKKACTFLSIFMIVTLFFLSCIVALPSQAAPANSGFKLGVYKNAGGIINSYNEKLYIQYTTYFLEKYGKLPSPVNLSAIKAKPTLETESLNSITGGCGIESAPYDTAYDIRDIIDSLPLMPPGVAVSDPFFLLANEVSYRKEQGLPITFDDLVKSCSEDFNPSTGGLAYNLAYLNYKDNWLKILQAYQKRYAADYPAIRDALNKLKGQATEYAKANKIPLGVTGEIYEAPASILDDPEYEKHYVLMPQEQWSDTTFSDDNASSGIADVDSNNNDPQKWLDKIHLGLDLAGLVPVIGEPIDGLNAIMYYIEGDKVNALLSAGAMAPFVGDGITGVKLTARGAKYATELTDSYKLIKRVDGFDAFNTLKKSLQPRPKGDVWHHVVEQYQTIKSKFSTKTIQKSENLTAVPRSVDAEASSYFGSKHDFTEGKTLRDWLFGKSYEEQFKQGETVLEKLERLYAEAIQRTGLSKEKFTEITLTPKSRRPYPSEYLGSDYITSHLAKFKGGVTKISSAENLAKYPIVGAPGGTFVFPKSVADDLINKARGDIYKLEESLGLPSGTLGKNPVRIDIDSPSGLRMSSGREIGANGKWIPGGYTSGGLPEAIIDRALPGTYTSKPII